MTGSNGLGAAGNVNRFTNPGAVFAEFRNPILGLDGETGGSRLPKKRGGIPMKTMAFVAVKGAYGSAVGAPGTAIIGAWSGESEGVSRAGSARKGLLGATSHI